jgi:hypothetical protein
LSAYSCKLKHIIIAFPQSIQNRAQIAGDIGNDFGEDGNGIDKVSLPENMRIRAQNDTGNDSDDGNDILHTFQCPPSDYPPNCYYCEYKPDSKDHYEQHIVLKHNHRIAYPNKAEIEKRGLKPQGKEWEI